MNRTYLAYKRKSVLNHLQINYTLIKKVIIYLIATNWLSSVRYQNIESLDDSNLRDSIQKTKGSFFIIFFLKWEFNATLHNSMIYRINTH